MIRETEELSRFEADFSANPPLPLEQALALVEAMWREGISIGVLPPRDPLKGIDVDIRIAKAINSCLKSC